MWPFKKKTNLKSLRTKVIKQQKKEWEKRLNAAVKTANEVAINGKISLTISDSLLRCPYNINRPQEDIVKDLEKRFKGCVIRISNHLNQTIIEVNWDD